MPNGNRRRIVVARSAPTAIPAPFLETEREADARGREAKISRTAYGTKIVSTRKNAVLNTSCVSRIGRRSAWRATNARPSTCPAEVCDQRARAVDFHAAQAGEQHDGDQRQAGRGREGGAGADPAEGRRRCAGPPVKASVRASSMRALAARSALGEPGSERMPGVATLYATVPQAGQRAEEGEQRPRDEAGLHETQDGEKRRRAQPLRPDHQARSRDAIGEQARGDREEQEGQGQGHLQQPARPPASRASSAITATMAAAASARIRSADCAARFDQARRTNAEGSVGRLRDHCVSIRRQEAATWRSPRRAAIRFPGPLGKREPRMTLVPTGRGTAGCAINGPSAKPKPLLRRLRGPLHGRGVAVEDCGTMDKFTVLESVAAPMRIINVDTDMIIPKQYLKTIKRTGLGVGLFSEMRYRDDGTENPDFVLNQPAYRKAEILVAGDNFGCGSSREHAPWALLDFGIRCVISTGFADIFYNNCFQNGILPIVVSPEDLEKLFDDAERGANATLTVDLEKQEIRGPDGGTVTFDIDPFRKHCLLNGLDGIGLTLQKGAAIDTLRKEAERARLGLTQRISPDLGRLPRLCPILTGLLAHSRA